MLGNVSKFQKRTIFGECTKLYCYNVVSLMYCIRYQISDGFNIVGPLLSLFSQDTFIVESQLYLFLFTVFSELTNTINKPGKKKKFRSWKISEWQFYFQTIQRKIFSFIPLQFIHLLFFACGFCSSLFPCS